MALHEMLIIIHEVAAISWALAKTCRQQSMDVGDGDGSGCGYLATNGLFLWTTRAGLAELTVPDDRDARRQF